MISRKTSDFKLKSFVAALILTMTSQPLLAQYFQGPQTMSLAGSGRGAEFGLETVHLNPATLVYAPQGDAALFYNFGKIPENGHNKETMAVSALENNPDTLFSGSLNFVKQTFKFEDRNKITEESWLLYGAKKFLNRWSLGLGFHHMRQNDYQYGIKNYFQSSVGIHYKFSQHLGVGMSYLNFLDSYDYEPNSIVPELGVGMTYFYQDMLRVQLDVIQLTRGNPSKKLKYALGIESFLNDYVSLRLGYRINKVVDKNTVHAGLGLNGPRLQLHYSYSQDPKINKNAMHGVDLRVPFW